MHIFLSYTTFWKTIVTNKITFHSINIGFHSKHISESINQFMSTHKIQFIYIAFLFENAPVSLINVKFPEVCAFQFMNL